MCAASRRFQWVVDWPWRHRSAVQGESSRLSWELILPSVIEELNQLNQSTEADFLAVGGMLGSLMSSAREMSSEATTMAEFVSGEKGRAACDALSTVLQRTREMQEGTTATTRSLSELSLLTAQIRTGFGGFQQTVSSFRLVATLARIETERIGSGNSDLGHLAEEFRVHTNNVVARVSDVLDDVGFVEKRIAATISTVTELLGKKLKTIPSLVINIQENLDAFRTRQQHATEASQSLAHGFDALCGSIAEIVGAIQSHDITRQQIEHVSQALSDIRNGSTDLHGANRMSSAQALALRVQCGQLQSADRLFTASVNDIDRQLQAISAQIGKMMSSHQKLLDLDQDGGDSVLPELGRCFELILEAIANYSELEASIASAMAEFGEVLDRLGRSLQDVRSMAQHVKWLAINARISAAHLGSPGEPLNIVAESMQGLQLDCETRCETTDVRIAAMRDVLQGSGHAQGEAQAEEHVGGRVRALIAELNSSSASSAGRWKYIQECAASLSESVQSGRERLAVGGRVSETLRRCAERIRPFAAASADLALPQNGESSAFEQIEQRYTMQAEREIHEELTGKLQQKSEPGEFVHAVAAQVEDAEFGDNIELF